MNPKNTNAAEMLKKPKTEKRCNLEMFFQELQIAEGEVTK